MRFSLRSEIVTGNAAARALRLTRMRDSKLKLGGMAAAILCVCVAGAADAQRSHAPRDPALVLAEEIARRVHTFHNFRGAVAHGVFLNDPARVFAIRTTSSCLEELTSLHIAHETFRTARSPIPTPVRLEGEPIGGVTFRKLRDAAPFIVACELAVRLPRIAGVLRAHRIHTVDVMSSWRLTPRTSFHTMGLALDLNTFTRDDGSTLDVMRDYPMQPDAPTCEDVDASARPAGPGAALVALACDLFERAGLQTMITPNYSEGHRNHFHIDIRPNDSRLFVR